MADNDHLYSARLESSVGDRPRWAAPSGRVQSHPLFSIHLFGLEDRKLDRILTGALLALVVATRIMAFPASIWEQDEAYLASGVVRFEPTDNHPHPPWFPLWIALGKVVAPVVGDAAAGLQLISALLGVWTLFPLSALFGLWLRRELAVGVAVLYLFTPAAWFLSGRAFSETPATFFLLLSAAIWLRRDESTRISAAGSLTAGLCLLVRPQFAPAILGLAALRWWRGRSLRDALLVFGPLTAAVVAGFGAVVLAAGGFGPTWRALTTHAGYHLNRLSDVSWSFAGLGFSRALIHPGIAGGWLLLSLAGLTVWHRHRRAAGSPWPLVGGALAPLLITVFGLSNPAHARYALPLLALSCGLVVVALASRMRWLPLIAISCVVAASIAGAWPQLGDYRRLPSPPIRALRAAFLAVDRDASLLVVDRTMLSFVEYEQISTGSSLKMINDLQIRTGAVKLNPEEAVVAVSDRGRGDFVISADSELSFSTELPWLRRLGQDRFLDLSLAVGAEVGPGPAVP